MFEQTPLVPDAGQLFSLYKDINDIQLEQADDLVDIMLEQWYKKIITFHNYGFVFFYFDQLIREEITAEQFLTMGDIEGQIEDQINPHVYREEHPLHLHSLTPEIVESWSSEDLIVIDTIMSDYYESQYWLISSPAKIFVLK